MSTPAAGPAPAGGAPAASSPAPHPSSSPAPGPSDGSGHAPPSGGEGSGPESASTPQTADGSQSPPPADTAEAAEATGGFGRGAFRHGAVHEALANVGGDQVAGDKYVFLSGSRQQRLRRVSPLLLERARHAFTAPHNWAEVRAACGKRRIVIIRAAEGSGKTTAALRLLLSHAAADRIFTLDREIDLSTLPMLVEGEPAAPGTATGFLLDWPGTLAGLTAARLHSLEDALERVDARLLLTHDQDAGMGEADLLEFVVALPARPSPEAIVEGYLHWKLGASEAKRLSKDPAVVELIARHLGEDASCRLAADLASALVDAVEAADSQAPDFALLGHRLNRRDTEDFGIWLEGLRDPRVHSLAVALAVLNGLPHEQVAAATRDLHRALMRRDDPENQAPQDQDEERRPLVPDPYGLPLRRRLALLRAQVSPARVRTAVGLVPAQVIAYQDPGYPSRVIRHTWSEYQVQDVLLRWLSRLAVSPSEQVRIYAGAALGLIACDSFAFLTDQVLRPWAYSERPYEREAVAYALSVCAQDERLRGVVRELVAAWYRDTAHTTAQATAARAYGIGLAATEPLAAVDALVRLTPVDSVRVAVAVGDSLTDLLTEQEDLATVVLHRLHGATTAAEQRSRPSALLAFLIIAAQLVVESKDADDAPAWPALLHRADRDAEIRPLLVALWRAALNEPVYRQEAAQVLRTWAARAETDQPLREAFLRLIGAIATGDARSASIIQRCALDWGQAGLAPLSACAEAVSTLLSRSGFSDAGRLRTEGVPS